MPKPGPLPQTSHTAATSHSLGLSGKVARPHSGGPVRVTRRPATPRTGEDYATGSVADR
jgi:hypothetical protein